MGGLIEGVVSVCLDGHRSLCISPVCVSVCTKTDQEDESRPAAASEKSISTVYGHAGTGKVVIINLP